MYAVAGWRGVEGLRRSIGWKPSPITSISHPQILMKGGGLVGSERNSRSYLRLP